MSRAIWILRAFALFSTLAVAQANAPEERVVVHDLGTDHFVAGDAVHVDKAVAGDLIAAGGRVGLDAPPTGEAIVAGGRIRLDASVGRSVYAAGGEVMINAPIGGNARLAGGRVELGPKAQVAGSVSVAAGEVRIEGAVKG